MVSARRVLEGELPLAQLPRLASLLNDAEGSARYRIEFGRDALDVPFAKLLIEAGLPLVCQRSLQPFVEPYFQVVGQVWERRSSEVAQKVTVGLFPRWAIEQSTVDQALTWAEHDHPTALKRLVSEGRSGVERALRARAADAS